VLLLLPVPQGIKLGVSSRGWASVVTDPHSKQVVVEPDYQLITFDFVPEPSNAGAYVVPICKRYRYGTSALAVHCVLLLPAAVVECRSQQMACSQQPYLGRAVASASHQVEAITHVPCS
jgi:hypothetical protein